MCGFLWWINVILANSSCAQVISECTVVTASPSPKHPTYNYLYESNTHGTDLSLDPQAVLYSI